MKRFFSLLLIFTITFLTLSGCVDSVPEGGVSISELMPKNTSGLLDGNGEYSDWIELFNSSDESISLNGFSITDDAQDKKQYVFPDIALGGGEYLVLFASGVEYTDSDNRLIYLPFAISSSGETICLYDTDGRVLSRVTVPQSVADKSYGPDSDGKTVMFRSPTPGNKNSNSEDVAVSDAVSDISGTEPDNSVSVYINEYSTNETVTLTDGDGKLVSWVELYNYGKNDVSLAGYYLSDDSSKSDKWQFPDVTLKSGDYIIVYLSGKEKSYAKAGDELHADFELSGKESDLILSSPKLSVIDSAPVYELFANLTCGRPENEPSVFRFFSKATPLSANNLEGFDSVDSAALNDNKELVITEIAAVNSGGDAAPDGNHYDYIELYNPTDKPVDLSAYRLSDSLDDGKRKNIGNIILKPHEYTAVYCGNTDKLKKGTAYLDIGLNRYGETVYLFDESSVIADSLEYSMLRDGFSCGRKLGGGYEPCYFPAQTPGKKNSNIILKAAVQAPSFSLLSTYVKKGTKISLSCSDGCKIHYTLDGSLPTESSPVYSEEISVSKTMTVRAIACRSGYMSSEDVSASYIVGRKHDLPVVFLATDSDNLYSNKTGILADGPNKGEFPYVNANFWKDWERPVSFEYMNESGVSQLCLNAGLKVFGQYSRANKQKSLSVNFKGKYGLSEVCYPFFDDCPVNVFSAVILRAGGQDNNRAFLRDAFCAMTVKNQMDVDIMDYQPVVVYLNGGYYGVFNMREKVNEEYLENHHGIDPNNIDMIKGDSYVVCGSMTDYSALLDYAKNHDLSVKKNYDYICSIVDIDNLICYWMTESFFANSDTGNIKCYRDKSSGGKWRWILFDMDWALTSSTYKNNSVYNYIDPKGHGVSDMFSTTLMCALIKNDSFMERLLELNGEHYKTTFSKKRMLAIYDAMVDSISGEMSYHIDYWGVPSSYGNWENQCSSLRKIISEMPELFLQKMIKTFKLTDMQVDKYFR